MNLYLDFDGVIADTITVTYKMIEELGIDIRDSDKVRDFYINLNWFDLLNDAKQINNSVECIKQLQKSNLYYLSILTTVHSNDEVIAKNRYIERNNLQIPIIAVPVGKSKDEVVDAKGSILVDDFNGNLYSWEKAGGIAVKFSNKSSDKFNTISSLSELNNEVFVKKLVKNR